MLPGSPQKKDDPKYDLVPTGAQMGGWIFDCQ